MHALNVTKQAIALSKVMKVGSSRISYGDMEVSYRNRNGVFSIERVQRERFEWDTIFSLDTYDNEKFLAANELVIVAAALAAKQSVIKVGKTTFFVECEEEKEEPFVVDDIGPRGQMNTIDALTLGAVFLGTLAGATIRRRGR